MSGPREPDVDLTKGFYVKLYECALRSRKLARVGIDGLGWFVALCLQADQYGNLIGDPVVIRGRLPYLAVTEESIAAAIERLAGAGLVSPYGAGGETYLHIHRWLEFQPAGKNGRRVRTCPASPEEIMADELEGVDPRDAAAVTRLREAERLPDFRGQPDPIKWHQFVVAHIASGLKLTRAECTRERRALFAVARCLWDRADRDDAAGEVIDLARDKAGLIGAEGVPRLWMADLVQRGLYVKGYKGNGTAHA